MLAEITPANPLALIRQRLAQESHAWHELGSTDEWLCIVNPSGQELWLIAGRQIVTSDRLEVLALGTAARLTAGEPLSATVAAVSACGALPVIPWGVGKWWGRRGRLLSDWFRERAAATPSTVPVWLGDSFGRPQSSPPSAIWRQAALSGVSMLPGTDPLAIPQHETLAGRYGFSLSAQLTSHAPVATFKQALIEHRSMIRPLGRRTSWAQLMSDQWSFRQRRTSTPRPEGQLT